MWGLHTGAVEILTDRTVATHKTWIVNIYFVQHPT